MLAHAWDAEAFTATDIMEATGLTRSTAIESTQDLIARGLLSELPNARAVGDYRKGRPARRFALRTDAATLVGVDAGNEHLIVRVTDLRSQELTTHHRSFERADDEPTARRRAVVAAVNAAVSETGRTLEDVLALCIGVPAPVDSAGLSPRHPHGFWQRMNPDLIHAFDGIPLVGVHNDASLAAIAEGSVGAAIGCQDYIALLAGSRMGAGVVTDGAVLRGSHGGVGEMVAFDHVQGVGNAEGLGVRIATWAADLVRHGEAVPTGALARLAPEQIDAPAVLRLASSGDPDAQRVVDRASTTLARIVSVLGSMFDPQRVVVSGAVASGFSDVVAAARAALPTDLDLPAPELFVSRLGADVVVVGAVAAASALARDRALDVIG
ncbi:ROK family protein [Microbacterium dextranolyticum]|uniref:Transcriptional regulator n=1 Tax=Microbacterium dextranolyticum TaxID=36806 RepID=A0A9W6M767_9MICO|nr:ROK family protein [Microbacterium dextranolyticum]MBM7464086.1 putative NBD/HSP70 family sugar kinase [Microbacterium dextranolyticum]GLJ96586.1 transcriptional regulator [Microbacterium dextranolyticum]